MTSGFKYIHKKNFWFTDENLGFAVINIFEIFGEDSMYLQKDELLISKIIRSGFLSSKYISARDTGNDYPLDGIKLETLHGPFYISRLSGSDFIHITYDEFYQTLNSLTNDSDWGDDKTAFLENIVSVSSVLKDIDIPRKQKVYYLNTDFVETQKKVLYSQYTYFLLFIIPVIDTKEVIILDFGGD